MKIKRSDWVSCVSDNEPNPAIGLVRRVAKDYSWVDVRWRSGSEEWTKRMKPEWLRIHTTIPCRALGSGWEVTDMNREKELREEKA